MSHIDQQCDEIIESYINKNVKGTLDFVQQSQSGLYDTYQKVRGSQDPVVPKSKILSPSYKGSAAGTGSSGVEVHDYVNLLQSQSSGSTMFPSASSSSSSKAGGGSVGKTGPAGRGQDSKKLLRGFGKT